jgi:hypothetical protein
MEDVESNTLKQLCSARLRLQGDEWEMAFGGHSGTDPPLKCRICPAIIGAVIGNCPSG